MLLLAGAAVLATSCLERSFSEEEGRFATQTGEINVPCDMFDGRNMVKDTIFVTSNRSWSADIVEDDVDWLTLDIPGHQDMARVSEVTALALAFLDNETEQPRSATVHISCADGDKDIVVTQEAITYRLAVLSDQDIFEGVSSEGDTLKLKVNTNTEWSVKVSDGSTADVRFSTKARTIDATQTLESKYSRTIDVVVVENEELDSKTASIILSAKGCEDIEIPLSQKPGHPYIRFTGDEGDHYVAEPGRPDCTIPLKTNIPWTAEVLSSDGFADGEVSVAASGVKGLQNVAVTFPYCIDFDTPGNIVIRFSGEGLETPVDFTITQRPCIRIMWYDYLNKKLLGATDATYPFVTPPLSDIKTSVSNAIAAMKNVRVPFVTKRGGFTFTIFSVNGVYRNGGFGLSFGGTANDYLELPVIEGHRLVSIVYGWGCTRTYSTATLTLQVQDTSGTPVVGGDFKHAGSTTAPVIDTMDLSGTVNDTAYRIVNVPGGSNFSIGDLILYYE